MLPTLCDILSRYPDSDKNSIHSYGPVYEELFAPWRSKAKRVLEIGVRHGGSLKAWRDYFTNADLIVGVDDGSEAGVWEPDRPGIEVVVANTLKPTTIAAVAAEYGPFDVVIDDGLHHPYSQVAAFATIRPFLSPEFTYVIEDVEDIGFATKIADLFGGKAIDLRERKLRHDDILVVFSSGGSGS